MKKAVKKGGKAVLFVLLFCVLFSCVSAALNSTGDYRHQNWIRSFYAEKKNSLDAVYVGSSAAYAFWCSPVAWHDYGIAVHPFTTSGQRILMTKYVIEEGRKTQPDALYILNMNTIGTTYSTAHLHYLADEMPMSLNKLRLIREVCDYSDFDQKEFILPIYRYHSRWSTLTYKDFNLSFNTYKGAPSYTGFLKNKTNVSGNYEQTDEKTRPSETYMKQLDSLLSYIEENGVRVLFVFSPQGIDAKRQSYFHYITAYLREKGYDVLNMFECMEETGIDLKTDFYNTRHTNLNGALKTTDYLAKYLVEHYGFSDKRGEKAYESWDRAYEDYRLLINKYAKSSG